MNASGLNDHVGSEIDKKKSFISTDIEYLDKFIDLNVKAVAYLIEISKKNLNKIEFNSKYYILIWVKKSISSNV